MPSPSARRDTPRTALNVVANWATFGFGVAMSFFLSPFIVHSLGDASYGVWTMLASMVGYMGLLDLGVRSAVTRYVARHHALGQDRKASRTASTGLAIFLGVGFLAVLAAIILALAVPQRFNIPPHLLSSARLIIVLGGLSVAVALISGVFGGLIAAMQRFDRLGLLEVSVGVFRAALVVVTLRAGGGLVALATVQLAASALRGALEWYTARRLYPELEFALRHVRLHHVRRILSYSGYASVLHITAQVMYAADALVIGAFLPVAQITFFAIASALTDYVRSVVGGISQTVPPRLSALGADTSAVADVILRMGRIATLVTLPIVLTFVLRGGTFIGLWMGPSYREVAGRLLWILAIAIGPMAARQVAMGAAFGVSRHRIFVPFQIVEAALNLALSIYWVRTLGLVGVALGTVVPNLVTSFLVLPWIMRQTFGIRARPLIWEWWARPAISLVPFAIATYVIEHAWAAPNLVVYFGQVALALAIAAPGIWFVGLSSAERAVSRRVIPFRALSAPDKSGR